MSSRALFDDSSSDEDDNIKQPNAPVKNEGVKNEANDDDSKVGDEDNDSDSLPDKSKDAPAAASSNRPSILQDSDEEGDVEFDDAGAVVGSSRPEGETVADGEGGGRQSQDDSYDNDGEGGGPVEKIVKAPPKKASVLDLPQPADDISIHMTKLPNLVGIQTQAFDANNFLADEEEKSFRGYVHNMIRWRYKQDDDGEMVRDSDGNPIRESNSKFVQWSDGSFTLHIGNDSFEIDAIDSSQPSGFKGLNGYMFMSQKAVYDEASNPQDQGDTILEGVRGVASRMVVRPSSLQSEAHKSLTVAVRQKTLKTARIARHVTELDPEKTKEDSIRTDQDAYKIAPRKRPGQRAPVSRRRFDYEDDEAYDSTNIKDLKKRTLMDDDLDDYGDESDGDDDKYSGTFQRDRKRKKQLEEEEDDDDEEELVFGEDSDDEDAVVKAHKKKRGNQKSVFDEED